MKPSGETTVNRTTGDGLATSPTLEPTKNQQPLIANVDQPDAAMIRKTNTSTKNHD